MDPPSRGVYNYKAFVALCERAKSSTTRITGSGMKQLRKRLLDRNVPERDVQQLVCAFFASYEGYIDKRAVCTAHLGTPNYEHAHRVGPPFPGSAHIQDRANRKQITATTTHGGNITGHGQVTPTEDQRQDAVGHDRIAHDTACHQGDVSHGLVGAARHRDTTYRDHNTAATGLPRGSSVRIRTSSAATPHGNIGGCDQVITTVDSDQDTAGRRGVVRGTAQRVETTLNSRNTAAYHQDAVRHDQIPGTVTQCASSTAPNRTGDVSAGYTYIPPDISIRDVNRRSQVIPAVATQQTSTGRIATVPTPRNRMTADSIAHSQYLAGRYVQSGQITAAAVHRRNTPGSERIAILNAHATTRNDHDAARRGRIDIDTSSHRHVESHGGGGANGGASIDNTPITIAASHAHNTRVSSYADHNARSPSSDQTDEDMELSDDDNQSDESSDDNGFVELSDGEYECEVGDPYYDESGIQVVDVDWHPTTIPYALVRQDYRTRSDNRRRDERVARRTN